MCSAVRIAVIALLLFLTRPATAAPQGAEDTPQWMQFWTRDADAGSVKPDPEVRHAGRETLRVEHTGAKDWSLPRDQRIHVEPGDLFEMHSALRVEGKGSVIIGVVAYGPKDEPVDWYLGRQTAVAGKDWQELQSRFTIPAGVVSIQPRVTGDGPVMLHIDGLTIQKTGNLKSLRPKNLARTIELSNALLTVSLDTNDLTLHVTDKRNKHQWDQQAATPDCIITGAKAGKSLELTVLSANSGQTIQIGISLQPDQPEVVVQLSGEGALARPLALPQPFVSPPKSYLVLPMNEGISYPVEDVTQAGRRMAGYSGHGMCMAFCGVTDGQAGQMEILETPDDAAIRLITSDQRLAIAPEWDSQKGQFGYPRVIRYVFFDRGGHVAMAKRYRAYAREKGLLKTLAEKRKTNPSIDLLVGAVNVWCWDEDSVRIARELQSAGIARMLWSSAQPPAKLRQLNALPGVLTSRYDIYQDLMDPSKFDLLKWQHSDWTSGGWPNDILLDERGEWVRGWEIETKAGGMLPCGVLCDERAPEYARKRIREELKNSPYRCRFIDTTTASPWRECYSPDHPMTRSDSRQKKMELLGVVSGEFKLVTGSETGHDAAVPYADYFEGMLSLGDYRVPDAGRDMTRIWTEVPENVSKYQVGQQYRLPLWELVYHDCLVAQWYWGDYNNKLPAIWDKRDLFNVLYGTPPMFMFDEALWKSQKSRFLQSYKTTGGVARACGYSEMTDHQFLTPDRNVQQTTFANGVVVTVNFGTAPFTLPDGASVKPLASVVKGLPK